MITVRLVFARLKLFDRLRLTFRRPLLVLITVRDNYHFVVNKLGEISNVNQAQRA